jgi:hypothetical protein
MGQVTVAFPLDVRPHKHHHLTELTAAKSGCVEGRLEEPAMLRHTDNVVEVEKSPTVSRT